MRTRIILLILLSPLYILAQNSSKKDVVKNKIKLEKLTTTKFEKLIENEPAILIDFYAVWCAPCKKLAPIMEKVAKEKNIKLLKIDVDKNPELAKKLNIEGLPTVHLYKNGKLEWDNLGFISEEELMKKI